MAACPSPRRRSRWSVPRGTTCSLADAEPREDRIEQLFAGVLAGDVVERMLRQAMTALMSNDRKLAAEVSRMDNIVDRLDEAIKLYVT